MSSNAARYQSYISTGLTHPWPPQATGKFSVSTNASTVTNSVYGPPMAKGNNYAAGGTVVFALNGVDNQHSRSALSALRGENPQARNVLNGAPVLGYDGSGLSVLERLLMMQEQITPLGVFSQGLQDVPVGSHLIPVTFTGAVTVTAAKGPFVPGTRLCCILPDPQVPTEGKVEQSRPECIHPMVVPESEAGHMLSLADMIRRVETTTEYEHVKNAVTNPGAASTAPFIATTGKLLHLQRVMAVVDALMLMVGGYDRLHKQEERKKAVEAFITPVDLSAAIQDLDASKSVNRRLRNSMLAMHNKNPLELLINSVSAYMRHLDEFTIGTALTPSKSTSPTDVYVNLSIGR